MRSGTRASAATLGIAAVLGLNACALTEGDEEQVGQASSVDPETETTAQQGSGDEEGTPAAGSGEDTTPDPDEALQTVTYAMTGPTEGEITMALQGLEVGEEGMLITVTFVPEYEQGDEPAHFVEDMHNPDNANIVNYLLPVVSDRDNLKAYYVPLDNPARAGGGWGTGSDNAWATNVNLHVRSGEALTMWAYVPTPQDDIDTADVSVVPGAPEFRDVEIDWGDHSPADHGGSDGADEDGADEDGANEDETAQDDDE